jgi:spoIIIJ-associated protein
MEWVETTGRTIEEAREAALEQLGVAETDAEFIILTEPRRGILGRFRQEARLRARVVPARPRPKRGGKGARKANDRTKGRSRSVAGDGSASAKGGKDKTVLVKAADRGSSGAGRSEPTEAKRADAEVRPMNGDFGVAQKGAVVPSVPSGEPAVEPAAEPGGSSGARKKRHRGSRGRGRGQVRAAATANSDNEQVEAMMETLSADEQGEKATTFLDGLMHELGMTATTSFSSSEEGIQVAIEGSDLGALVGPAGATLSALQEVTRAVLQRYTGGHGERIIVDVGGYRAKRAEALARFTTSIAQEVIASGTERRLEPMSAADRKVVHDTVNAIEGVVTRSEGEEPRRYVVISPKAGE